MGLKVCLLDRVGLTSADPTLAGLRGPGDRSGPRAMTRARGVGLDRWPSVSRWKSRRLTRMAGSK